MRYRGELLTERQRKERNRVNVLPQVGRKIKCVLLQKDYNI